MLFKRQSSVARSAQFAAEEPIALACEPADETSIKVPGESQPTAQELEIAGLQAETSALQRDLDSLRSEFETAVKAAEQRAYTLALEQHVADDAAHIEAFRDALSAARTSFDNALSSAVLPTATSIAGEMLARLVKPVAGENEWLARSIARRLEDLRANAVVKVAVPPSLMEGKLAAELSAQMPAGTTIEVNADLPTNTARIVLRLGQIEIDPAFGLVKALARVGEADAEV